MKNYIIVCGGTGGHISPGIAVAEELVSRGKNCTLVVSDKKVDQQMLSKYPGLKHIVTTAKPFSLNIFKLIKFFYSQTRATIFALRFLMKNNIDCVIGFGGFTNLPFVLAGFLLRKRIVLHESNRVIGKSIKVLALFADRIYLPPKVRFNSKILNKKVKHVGYPLRKEFSLIDKKLARKKLGINDDRKLVLVFGGSQGARILTTWAVQNYEILNQNNIIVYCITGHTDLNIKNESPNVFTEFSNEMCMLYSIADLIVSRAGAGTIAEAMFCKRPMMLIPYKYAAKDHQTKNAEYVASIGCGYCLPESKINNLTNLVISTLNSDKFSHAYDSVCYKDATNEIVDYVTK